MKISIGRPSSHEPVSWRSPATTQATRSTRHRHPGGAHGDIFRCRWPRRDTNNRQKQKNPVKCDKGRQVNQGSGARRAKGPGRVRRCPHKPLGAMDSGGTTVSSPEPLEQLIPGIRQDEKFLLELEAVSAGPERPAQSNKNISSMWPTIPAPMRPIRPNRFPRSRMRQACRNGKVTAFQSLIGSKQRARGCCRLNETPGTSYGAAYNTAQPSAAWAKSN